MGNSKVSIQKLKLAPLIASIFVLRLSFFVSAFTDFYLSLIRV